MFDDRTDAGNRLAERLERDGVEADVVLGVPRGGLPVARPVADALGVPLDVIVAKKMGASGNPELAIGAVGEDGSSWVNEDLVRRLGVTDEYIERERDRQAKAAREKAETYRDGRPVPDLTDDRVVVVDDGVATGATITACLRQVGNAGASHLVLAVPVGSPTSVERLHAEADEVVCLETPPHFSAVGQFYRVFEQVPDEVAREYLAR